MKHQPIPKVPGIPIFGSALKVFRKNPRDFLIEQHKSLGPIFRLKAMHINYVIIAGPSANKFTNGEGKRLLGSKKFWKNMLHELEADNFLIGMDGEEHILLRKMFKHSFSRSNADSKVKTIDELCQKMFSDVEPGEEFEVVERILQLSSQMIGCVMTDEIPERKELEDFLYYINTITNHFALNRLPAWMLKFKQTKFKNAKSLTFNFAENIIEKHLTGSTELDNFVDVVLEASEKCPHLFSKGDIRFSAILPLFAGIDTLGQTLNYALFELHKHPKILSELREEINDVWSDKIPDSSDLKKMQVLNSVIRETLRLHPSAFGVVRTASQDFEFEGYMVKKGEDLVVLTTAPHFMDEYFKNPTRFDIERYSPPRNEHLQREMFAPFGRGTHTCLGAGLAETLMGLVLGSILHNYEFEILDPNIKIKERINPTPSLGKQFKLRMLSKSYNDNN